MKRLGFVVLFSCFYLQFFAQNITNLSGDSVLFTGNNGGAELILQNHSRGIPGFLFNQGKGRTSFKGMLQKLNDSTFLLGGDTLKLSVGAYISLTGKDTVTGAKTFNPLVTAAAGSASGTVFNSSLTATAAGDTLVGVEFKLPVVHTTGQTYTLYQARFGKVLLDSGATTYKTFVKLDTSVKASILTRSVSNTPMDIIKPGGNNVPPELLSIQLPFKTNSTGSRLISSTSFMDSVYFTAGQQDYAFIKAIPVLTQQPGASGTLRGIYVRPDLTGVKNFRGIEVLVNAANSNALYATGSASSLFGGLVQYSNNYAGKFTARTLVDKNYVDSLANGQWVKNVPDINQVFHMGNVGIGGMASANAKLNVNGIVLANQVAVSTNAATWPDYVFAPGYPLPSLAATEAYVQKHRHLLGIPSAKKIEKDGLDVAEMQAALLKKMEELTLHVIRHERLLKAHEEALEALK